MRLFQRHSHRVGVDRPAGARADAVRDRHHPRDLRTRWNHAEEAFAFNGGVGACEPQWLEPGGKTLRQNRAYLLQPVTLQRADASQPGFAASDAIRTVFG